MMRRRGPGLIGVAATTAVVAGTAGAVHNRQENKQYEKQMAMQQQQQYEAMQQQAAIEAAAAQAVAAQQAAAAQAAPAPATAAPDTTAQLQKLAELKAAGVLSDEEFAAAKAKLLGL